MNNNFDLDERILAMTHEELLEEVADQIQCIKELMSLHRKEEGILKQENQMLKEALVDGTARADRATEKLKELEVTIDRETKAILMWRTNCYLLTAILAIVAISLIFK